ncbi:hypothetical protein CDD82_6009 [Ophiocordyceps australis]|uniref:Glycosyl hydrolase family 92 domain-containing protein n=1 Tax=Ophiocordyceps australis TaxID=1399860 RepID=A0A2C5ZRF8_9HYPO|nr:hypothetical protein CDD82_6009 [Ophiocordyceps australis]
MVQSLLDMYENEGWLPDCHMSMCQGWTQGGSNADVVLADGYVKNLSTTIDWNLALEAMRKDAEVEPLEWSHQGRGNIKSWREHGYVPCLDFDPVGFGTNSRSISRTLEYSYNDFCIATVAAGLEKPKELFDEYMSSSFGWRRLWRSTQPSKVRKKDTGFLGFLQPKYMNGTWGFQDPAYCSTVSDTFCSLTSNPSETFEASIWQYMFYTPHTMSTLISFVGGDNNFVDRLNFFHTSGLADISNEPVFLTVFLYHYAGRPGLSARRVMTYLPSFTTKYDGLPGNDDSGAMGSFLVFCAMGLFPVAGQDVYLVTPPLFEEVRIKSPVTGKTATIRNIGYDRKLKNRFVRTATLNGVDYTKSWVPHKFFTEGWTLELQLGEEESEWGRAPMDRPPSWTIQE